MPRTSDTPIPATFEKLLEAIRIALFSLQRNNDAPVMVAAPSIAAFRRQKLPDGATVKIKKRRGKRVSMRGPRNFRMTRLIQARWPEDGQWEATVPSLVYVLRGQADFHIEDYLVQCAQGNWLFIPAGISKPDAYLPYILDGSNRQCDLLWIYPGPLNGVGLECFICHSTAEKASVGQELGTSDIKSDFLVSLFNELNEQLLNYDNHPLVYHLLNVILLTLGEEIKSARAAIPWSRHLDQPVKRSRDIIDEACKHIESYLHHQLTIEKMARLLAVSPTTFTTQFRSKTGKSFNDYLTGKRLEGAERLLEDSGLPAHEVARSVGLTYERLRTLFHEYHHCSPGEYRKRKS
jgi:AraC-like DNA-binding protein